MHVHHRADPSEIIAHLNRPTACISPKYLYDDLGNKLFEAITCLPEYYPARIERELLSTYGTEIASRVGRVGVVVDLGAGNGEKAAALFPLLQPRQYLAVDFSADFVEQSCLRLQASFVGIEMFALAADLTQDWQLPQAVNAQPRLFFYPGASIGNFHPDEVQALLLRVRTICAEQDSLLIGVDLVKGTEPLQAAYDDALGVTAAFNRNVLRHLNGLIDADFVPQRWRHCARFNSDEGRMEMHLEATIDHAVTWTGGGRNFRAGERIHTENSYKYRLDDFEELLRLAGFAQVTHWTDKQRWYALCHARV